MKRYFAVLLSVALLLPMLNAAAYALSEEPASARTTLAGSSWAKISNIEIAAGRINGMTIPYGAEFSFNDVVGPRTKALGYQSAANGRGVKVTGGGVAQVATTLYLALRQMEQDIEYTSRKTYGGRFSDNYVSSGNDAILVDYSSGTDFSFINWGDDIVIEMWNSSDELCCSIRAAQVHTTDPFGSWSPGIPSNARSPIASASILISGSDKLRNNILLAASSINDTVLTSGDLFSFNATVGPRSERYGYQSALNGRGVKVVGGGVAQVASVLWLAVKKLDNIAVVEKSTYGSRYNQSYVASSNDAILTDYSGGTDFSFRYIGSSALTISTYISGDILYCDIYED